ncbi:MAG: hypothetical protein ACKO6F_11380 [Cyanobium sp.]
MCAVSFWEVAMLAARGRVDLHQAPGSWRLDWLQAGLQEITLARGATLLTGDQATLAWPGSLLRHAATA